METTRLQETREVVRVTACPESAARATPPGWTWRQLIIAAALGVILLVASAVVVTGPMRSGWSNAATETVSTNLARPTSGTPAVVCLGTADVRGGVVRLLPTVTGRVLRVHVEDNADVPPGQVLLTLDDRQARSQLREAEAALEVAESQCREARNGLNQHRLRLTQQQAALAAVRHELAAARLAAIHKNKLMEAKQLSVEEADAATEVAQKLKSLEQVEAAKLEALELRDPLQDIARAEADVRAKTALRDRARDAVGEYTLKAPTSGRVLRVLANPGDLVGPDHTDGALLFCPAGPRVVRAEVEQEYASRVEIGQQAVIEDAARSGGPTWHGKVVRIADWFTQRRIVAPDQIPLQEVRTLECLVELDANQPPLRIGQRVRVRLYGQ